MGHFFKRHALSIIGALAVGGMAWWWVEPKPVMVLECDAPAHAIEFTSDGSRCLVNVGYHDGPESLVDYSLIDLPMRSCFAVGKFNRSGGCRLGEDGSYYRWQVEGTDEHLVVCRTEPVSGTIECVFDRYYERFHSAQLAADGRTLMVVGSGDDGMERVEIWDVATDAPRTIAPPVRYSLYCSLSRDGRYCYACEWWGEKPDVSQRYVATLYHAITGDLIESEMLPTGTIAIGGHYSQESCMRRTPMTLTSTRDAFTGMQAYVPTVQAEVTSPADSLTPYFDGANVLSRDPEKDLYLTVDRSGSALEIVDVTGNAVASVLPPKGHLLSAQFVPSTRLVAMAWQPGWKKPPWLLGAEKQLGRTLIADDRMVRVTLVDWKSGQTVMSRTGVANANNSANASCTMAPNGQRVALAYTTADGSRVEFWNVPFRPWWVSYAAGAAAALMAWMGVRCLQTQIGRFAHVPRFDREGQS